VNGDVWDLERPLEGPCKLELLDFEHPEGTLYFYKLELDLRSSTGKRVFWHSSAHVLGEAAERHYGCHLCIGPPTDDGFFYEMAIEDRYKTSTCTFIRIFTFAPGLSRIRITQRSKKSRKALSKKSKSSNGSSYPKRPSSRCLL
jgi:hypothetical protein